MEQKRRPNPYRKEQGRRLKFERQVARDIEEANRRSRANEDADVVIDGDRRLLLRSPDGTYFELTVDNAGALGTTEVLK